MKLFLLLSISILASCSDDKNSFSKDENIYGSWEQTQNISHEEIESDNTNSSGTGLPDCLDGRDRF